MFLHIVLKCFLKFKNIVGMYWPKKTNFFCRFMVRAFKSQRKQVIIRSRFYSLPVSNLLKGRFEVDEYNGGWGKIREICNILLAG